MCIVYLIFWILCPTICEHYNLAAEAGKEICVTQRDDPIYPAQLSFKYKGIEFFQLLNATKI